MDLDAQFDRPFQLGLQLLIYASGQIFKKINKVPCLIPIVLGM